MNRKVLYRRMARAALVTLVATVAACDVVDPNTTAGPDQLIKLNQLGYLPHAEKIAIVPDTDQTEFKIVSTNNNEVIFKGPLSESMQWPPAGDSSFKRADFSSVTPPGRYYLVVGENTKSDTFFINDNVYEKVHNAALKAYYFNRASTALIARHAGAYARKMGHPDTDVRIHPSAASATRPAGSSIPSPKGWYDAGDYGKYIVNSGVTTFTLLTAYEHFPDFYKNLSLNIPESGNKLPDILDEILWNLDWMETMQDPEDGGVYHKLTTLNFSGGVMPDKATGQRYVMQKSTAAALDFAATMAVASRVFANFRKLYPHKEQTYRTEALKAWTWAQAHPDAVYIQPKDVSTGSYGDNILNDEFGWAAAELYILTGEQTYIDEFFKRHLNVEKPGWQNVSALGYISLAGHCGSILPSERCRQTFTALTKAADAIVKEYRHSEYLVPMGMEDYPWGSNDVALNKAFLLIQAYRIQPQPVYLEAALSVVDYIFGRNPTGYSFVTGYGHRPPMDIHHRPSYADHVIDPVPGLLVGGPHNGGEDNCTYPSKYPAKSYLDDWCSYSTNEIAINWNATLVYVLAAVQVLQQ